MKSPVLSIIIPTKNRSVLLREAIKSIEAQSSANWELVIVDDGSDDDTESMVQTFSNRDPRIRFFHRTGDVCGAPVSRNQGFTKSTGDAVMFLDSDDLVTPNCVAHRLGALERHSTVDMIVSQGGIFRHYPGDIGLLYNRLDFEDDLGHFLVHDNPWHTSGPTWRREAFEKVGLWDESLPSWQDWDQNVRSLIAGLRYMKLAKVDYYTRVVGGRSTISASSHNFENIRSHVECCKKVQRLFMQHGILTPRYQEALTGNFFFLCRHYIEAHRSGHALKTWFNLRRQNCVPFTSFLIGVIALTNDVAIKKCHATMRWLGNKWLHLFWKPWMFPFSSDTYYCLPKSTDNPSAETVNEDSQNHTAKMAGEKNGMD